MAVLSRKVAARAVMRPGFPEAFPEFKQVSDLHRQTGGPGTCMKCGAPQKAYDILIRILKVDQATAKKLRDYLGFQTLDLVEKVNKGRVEVVHLA